MKNQKMTMIAALVAVLGGLGCQPDSNSVPQKNIQEAPQTIQGDERGNGSELYSWVDGSAWFADPTRTIQTCINISSDFGVDAAGVKEALESSFQVWRNYITEKRIFEGKPQGFGVSVQLNVRSQCSGDEDLTIQAGHEDQLIRWHMGRFQTPIGMAVRTKYNDQEGWGQGFIWLRRRGSIQPAEVPGYPTMPGYQMTPDWSLSYSLRGILLHELGHVFGVSHIDGTIMSNEHAPRVIWGEESSRERFSGRIDHFRELVTCKSCDHRRVGILGPEGIPSNSQEEVRILNFNTLLGRQPAGSISAVLTGSIESGFTLTIGDSQGTNDFTLPGNGPSSFQFEGQAFKIVKAIPSSSQAEAMHGDFSRNSEARVTYSKITDHSGREIPIAIEQNMHSLLQPEIAGADSNGRPIISSHRLEIKLLLPGEMRTLFKEEFK